MKKKPIILGVALVLIGILIWRTPYILEWNYHREWSHIPERIRLTKGGFEFNCRHWSTRYFGASEIEELPSELDDHINYITNYMHTANVGTEVYFDISQASPSYFKCKCDRYLMVWRSAPTAEHDDFVVVEIQSNELVRFETFVEPNE